MTDRSRYLTVFEHSVLPVAENCGNDGITAAEAGLLANYRGFEITVDRRSVRFGHYCGLVHAGSRLIEILPKVETSSTAEQGRHILLRLLQQSGAFPILPREIVGQHLTASRLLDIFIEAFIRTVADICRGGLLSCYQEHEADLRVVRGRIITSRQFAKHFNRRDLVACRFDEFSPDNPWNQCLKATLSLVRPWITDARIGRLWPEVFAVFEDVAEVTVTRSTLDRLQFDRQAERYRGAIQWAQWILSVLSPSLRAGDHRAPGLLINMNTLFEAAVATFLGRSVSGHNITLRTQDTERSLATITGPDQHRAFQLRPDLVFRRHGLVVGVADTKWKRVEVDANGYLRPEHPDMYQMTAYAAAFECEDLALIYPWHRGLRESRETTYLLPQRGITSPRLHVACVDVTTDPMRILRGGESLISTDLSFRREKAC